MNLQQKWSSHSLFTLSSHVSNICLQQGLYVSYHSVATQRINHNGICYTNWLANISGDNFFLLIYKYNRFVSLKQSSDFSVVPQKY